MGKNAGERSKGRVVVYWLIAGYAGVAVTLLSFLGRWFFIFNLMTHFRLQYGIALVVLGALAWWAKRKWSASVFVAFALVNAWMIAPLYLPPADQSTSVESWARATTFNVNTRSGDKVMALAALQELEPDVLALLEVDRRWLVELDDFLKQYPYAKAVPRSDNFGVGLYSKFPISMETFFLGDQTVPTIVGKAKINGRTLAIIATHPLPPVSRSYADARDAQLRGLANLSVEFQQDSPVLLLGDLNATMWDAKFEGLLCEGMLNDSALGRGWNPTWPGGLSPLAIPIDHVLYSDDVLIHDRIVGPAGGSDHLPVTVDFSLVESLDD